MLKLGYHEENGYYSFGSRKGNEILIYGSIAVMQSADIKFEKEPVPFTYDEERFGDYGEFKIIPDSDFINILKIYLHRQKLSIVFLRSATTL